MPDKGHYQALKCEGDMGKKLPPDQQALYERIDEILWSEWDPIGVSDVPEARDEYYAYLPEVFRLTIDGASATSIAEYLHEVANDRMGLSSEMEPHLKVATKIRALRPST